ncbi:hypothetical protein [Streptomyces sp. ET3-23]|uniref:hypothetical protein n=1 Tax=Streptomyces sp. ET3-23 TaxID=2885643 RepID=UPI0022352501|nr:hypothetical protein [Streptomyces sp. ET3-23]
MEVQVTMLVCDECERRDVPARKYTLAVEGGEPIRKDLCLDDAAPLLKLFYPGASLASFAEEESATAESAEETAPEQAPEQETPPAPRTAPARRATPVKKTVAKKATPARKTAAKKTPAKKATTKKGAGRERLGARVMTLEQIEAEKAARKAESAS